MSEFVMPGDVVGVAEEFLPGNNVDSDSDGKLRSTVMGTVVRDAKAHIVHVKPIKDAQLLSVNTVVYGRVVAIPNDRVVIVRITSVGSDGGLVELKNKFTGLIPLSQLTNGRVDGASRLVGIGDIVKARVISRGPPYILTMRDPQLGVVYGACPRCGGPMRLINYEQLRCTVCNYVTSKKVSMSEYWIR
ncbi:exosome complex RNA-binding protein Csl4 [Vulcanisaeta thermophila]|uniref:exosome complex RNA-binding protein Csl4 n=1 Tax=Vulcanisaeta thermophila TaxID=867917 RepID=UPI000852F510|nr:exosome complex RNA-binding protein Csl4 [Vulcanisaeta thermophila]